MPNFDHDDVSCTIPFPCIYRGKVRDMYDVDAHHLLLVASDRLSAFDVVFDTPIEGKGAILNALSNFWFQKLDALVPNHIRLATRDLASAIEDPALYAALKPRAVVVKKLKALPIEAIVRGYVAGSGWKDYCATGSIAGIRLPEGLKLADKLPSALFTPSTKAAIGDHDETISFDQCCQLIGQTLAEKVRQVSLQLYEEASRYAFERGIIIADTKFEFGLDEQDQLVLMDEIFTPDSSRFWLKEAWQPGNNPPSFDKQFVRDYLETLNWDKNPPAPTLPTEIIDKTLQKYQEALHRLTAQ